MTLQIDETYNEHYHVKQEFVQYALDITQGRILACESVRKCCERYLSFFSRDDIYFNEDRAIAPVKFIYHLKHTESPFTGRPFDLVQWQRFFVYGVFGWYRKDTNTRLVRTVFCMVPRKSGKSALCAGLSLYCLMADGENGAFVTFCAPTREQAQICLRYATNFAEGINKGGILKINRAEIRFDYTRSLMKTFSSEAKHGDGYNASAAILDETEILKDSSLPDVLTSGQGMRKAPLLIQILTAGFDLYGYAKSYYDMCKDVLNGMKEDDSLFPLIYELDADDDWHDKSKWKKASPSLGETVRIDALEAEYRKALNMSTQEVNFKTKFLNQWCETKMAWIAADVIRKCMSKVDYDKLPETTDTMCYVGVDLASTQDFTAVSFLYKADGKYYFKVHFYLPEATLETSVNGHLYKQWARAGHLTVTEGNVTDYDYIVNDILNIDKKLTVVKVCYDAWGATAWALQMQERGMNMVPFSQSLGNFSPYTKELERQILMGNVVFDNNPIIRFCFANVVLTEDNNENIKPIKKKSSGKIDGVIASIMAFGGLLYDYNNTADLTVI